MSRSDVADRARSEIGSTACGPHAVRSVRVAITVRPCGSVAGGRCLEAIHPVAVGEQHLGPAVVQAVQHLVGLPHRVHRHGDRADRGDRLERQHPLGEVAHRDRHPVAGPTSEVDHQPAGDPRRPSWTSAKVSRSSSNTRKVRSLMLAGRARGSERGALTYTRRGPRRSVDVRQFVRSTGGGEGDRSPPGGLRRWAGRRGRGGVGHGAMLPLPTRAAHAAWAISARATRS